MRVFAAARLVPHWPVVVLAGVAAILLLTNLGSAYLWADEGDTAVLARSILDHGVPVAWDGITFIAPDFGQRLTSGFVMISHPWLQYYVTALSFAVFGETPWAARLPFALAGVVTVVIVYAMAVTLLRNRRVAISAAILLLVNVQFLLFARQARNYSLSALLTCLLIWQFHRLRSWTQTVAFVLIGIALFHSHPIGVATLAGLAAVTLFDRSVAHVRPWFWRGAPVVFLYAVPWLLASRTGYTTATDPLDSAAGLMSRVAQCLIEWASVTPLIGLVALGVVLMIRRPHIDAPVKMRRRRPSQARRLEPDERSLAATCGAVMLAQAGVLIATHPTEHMWILGLHHTTALIPLTVLITALLMAKVAGPRRVVFTALLVVLATTRLGQLHAWTFWAESRMLVQGDGALLHVPPNPVDRVLRTAPLHYLRSLRGMETGTVGRISAYLSEHADPGDIVITNYSWEPLYFHTRLPQGAKISASFPIHSVARARSLPEYVFGDAGVRWVVWRQAWPAYFRDQDCARILSRLEASGADVRLAYSVPETLYENRENVHFHRFAGGTRLFPYFRDLPDALIFEVQYPGRGGHGRAARTSS